MSNNQINFDHQDGARGAFCDLQNKRDLMTNPRTGAISASRLYKFVLGHADGAVQSELRSNLSLRRIYKSLLQQNAYFHIPEAIAASSEDFPERQCDGCVIRLQASRAESDQVYLIIEVADQRRDMPTTLSVFNEAGALEVLNLPAARNGVIQTIIDKNADLARLLADPKSETFLR